MKERLENIQAIFNGQVYNMNQVVTFDREDAEFLLSTVEEQAEKIAGTETYLLDITGKMDALHEYLRENHYGKGLGKHIVDVAIQVMEEQQTEIERYEKLLSVENKLLRKLDIEKRTLKGDVMNYNKEINRLRELYDAQTTLYRRLNKGYVAIADKNKKLREALEFYADYDNYKLSAEAEKAGLTGFINIMDMDNGEKARKALNESK